MHEVDAITVFRIVKSAKKLSMEAVTTKMNYTLARLQDSKPHAQEKMLWKVFNDTPCKKEHQDACVITSVSDLEGLALI